MNILHQYQLQPHNSFALSAICPVFLQPRSIDELINMTPHLTSPFYVLGEGSNTLFIEKETTVILQPKIKGIEVEEIGDDVFVTAKCGENWHQLVSYCTFHGFYGLENLALIPGSVGAAPVQNIGAYGTELADVVEQVTWLEFASSKIKTLSNQDCYFSYRDSIFKHALANKGVILDVTFRLSKKWKANLTYGGLDTLPENVSAKTVFEKVIAIREAKLPAPKKLPNAGSFFKNPIVDVKIFNQLKAQYENMPAYPQEDNKVKLAAGWLIEKAGLKGLRVGDVGIDKTQALVLVNYGSDDGKDLVELAKYVQQTISDKFNVFLQAEVRLLSQNGLVQLEQCK